MPALPRDNLLPSITVLSGPQGRSLAEDPAFHEAARQVGVDPNLIHLSSYGFASFGSSVSLSSCMRIVRNLSVWGPPAGDTLSLLSLAMSHQFEPTRGTRPEASGVRSAVPSEKTEQTSVRAPSFQCAHSFTFCGNQGSITRVGIREKDPSLPPEGSESTRSMLT